MTPDELKKAILKNAVRELAKFMGPAGEPPMERHPDCVLECQLAVDYGVDNQYSCSPRCARLAGVPPHHVGDARE